MVTVKAAPRVTSERGVCNPRGNYAQGVIISNQGGLPQGSPAGMENHVHVRRV